MSDLVKHIKSTKYRYCTVDEWEYVGGKRQYIAQSDCDLKVVISDIVYNVLPHTPIVHLIYERDSVLRFQMNADGVSMRILHRTHKAQENISSTLFWIYDYGEQPYECLSSFVDSNLGDTPLHTVLWNDLENDK